MADEEAPTARAVLRERYHKNIQSPISRSFSVHYLKRKAKHGARKPKSKTHRRNSQQ